MKRIMCAAMVLVFGLSAPALAGVEEGNYEVGFDYGQTQVDDNLGIDSTSSLVLRGGYHISNLFQLEGQFATSSDDGDVSGTPVDATMRLLMVNGVFNFRPNKKEIIPYVLVGVGKADVDVEVSGVTSTDDSLAYQIGAGTRIFFGKTKRTAFRFDVSRVSEETFDESSSHTTIAAGFTWRLGGK
jgi:hypothetical protein